MQQRLGLAQAMLHQPELIILDEPTDGVDPVGRKEIRDVLRELADSGTSNFLNSHLLQEIELICERVAILTSGSVRRTGSVRDLTQAIGESPMLFQIAASRSTAEACFDGISVSRIEETTPGLLDVHAVVPEQNLVDRVVDRLRDSGVSIATMHRRDLTLEEAFLRIVDEDAGQESSGDANDDSTPEVSQ